MAANQGGDKALGAQIGRFIAGLLVSGVILAPGRFALAEITLRPPALLNANAAADTANDDVPSLETNGAGVWIAVWRSAEDLNGAGTDTDIFFARSTNNGQSWTAPALLNSNGTTDTGNDAFPQIAADWNGNWIVVWQSNENVGGAGTDTDILFARSTNNGQTWTAPAPLNTNATTDTGGDETPRLATDGAGVWICVWESSENLNGAGIDYDILFARSTNSGQSWSAPQLLNTNGAADSLVDSTAHLAADGAGNWITVWHSNENLGGAGPDLDIFYARSTNNGLTWTAPALLNTNATSDTGADNSPEIATDGAGNWITVWRSAENYNTAGIDFDVFFSRSSDLGQTWSNPGFVNTNATTDLLADNSPRIMTDRRGNWFCAWSSFNNIGGSGLDEDIFYAQSTNAGQTWARPALLNTNGVADSGGDYNAQITTDNAGNWAVIWVSRENLNGAGSDEDIFVSGFSLGAFVPPGVLTGTVISAGTPQSCAAVRAVDPALTQTYVAALNPNGDYRLEAPAGNYLVTAYAPGLQPKSQWVTLRAGQTTTLHFSLDLDSQQTGVSGQVSDEVTGNPIVGARVTARLGGVLLAETFTCGGGFYELRFALSSKNGASITVGYEAGGYEKEEEETQVTAGEVTPQDEALNKSGPGAGALAGRVIAAGTPDGIASAQVTVRGPVYNSVQTAANGEYSFLALPDGDYLVEAGHEDFESSAQRKPVIALSVTEANFILQPRGGAPRLSVSPLNQSISNKAQTVDLNVFNTGRGVISWSADLLEGAEWVTMSKSVQGQNNGTVRLECAENPVQSKAPRQARLAISAPGFDPVEVVLTQARGEDINFDGQTNAVDVQISINGALDIQSLYNTDVDGNGRTDSVDVQLAILAALE